MLLILSAEFHACVATVDVADIRILHLAILVGFVFQTAGVGLELAVRVRLGSLARVAVLVAQRAGLLAEYRCPGSDTSRPTGRPVSESYLARGRPANLTCIPVSPKGHRYEGVQGNQENCRR